MDAKFRELRLGGILALTGQVYSRPLDFVGIAVEIRAVALAHSEVVD